MRRGTGRGRNKENAFWQSYSDIMASLLMVFILIMTGAILQIMLKYEADMEKLDKAIATAESIAEANREKAAELERIVGIREEIIEALVKEFSNSDMEGKLTIDEQTGAVVFDSNLLFDFNERTLKEEGKEFLKSFMPKYTKLLLSEKFKQYVAEIIIEGHSDLVCGYIYNMGVSMERAYRVADYTLKTTEIFSQEELDVLRKYITVNGRSESEPVLGPDGQPDADASRRVELQFRLKEDEMIEMMNKTLSGED